MNNFLSKLAAEIAPYKAGEQPKDGVYIKLNTNENPYPPSPAAKEALADFDLNKLRLYPDNNAVLLRKAIAKHENLDENQVFAGNGSDEVLALCYAAFFGSGSKIAFADLTYSFYPVFADFFNVNYDLFKLGNDYKIKNGDYLNAKNYKGLIICNPNAPTGTGITLDTIEEIVKKNADKVILIDEAYIDFYAGQSAAPLVKKYNNLVVVKTFSKSYALAGMRCGYAAANAALIEGLNKMRDSFNSYPLDAVCQRVCEAAIADRKYYSGIIKKIIKTRENFTAGLKKAGFTVLDSNANFVFAKSDKISGFDMYTKLKAKKILVRYFGSDRTKDFVRITVGTDNDMKKCLAEMEKL